MVSKRGAGGFTTRVTGPPAEGMEQSNDAVRLLNLGVSKHPA